MQGQPGQGMPMPSNGPNGQVMVNRTVSQPGQMPNSHSISDSSMGPQGLVSMAPMTSMPSDMQGTVVSSMGPQSQAGMVPGMRPGMNMGMVGQQTIISSQMNGPNTMVRTVGQNMGGMGGMQLRQGVPGMMPGGNRMITPGVRMPNVGVSRNVCVPFYLSFPLLHVILIFSIAYFAFSSAWRHGEWHGNASGGHELNARRDEYGTRPGRSSVSTTTLPHSA